MAYLLTSTSLAMVDVCSVDWLVGTYRETLSRQSANFRAIRVGFTPMNQPTVQESGAIHINVIVTPCSISCHLFSIHVFVPIKTGAVENYLYVP